MTEMPVWVGLAASAGVGGLAFCGDGGAAWWWLLFRKHSPLASLPKPAGQSLDQEFDRQPLVCVHLRLFGESGHLGGRTTATIMNVCRLPA